MAYTKEIIEQAYETLNHTTDSQLRKEANLLLVQFQESDEAWKVSEQLLTSQLETSQFLGSQVLYKKLLTSFSYLKTDLEITTLRDNLLLFLENNKGRLGKVCYSRLCMCLSVIGILTIGTCWESCISDLIQYSNKSVHNLDISLKILIHLPQALDDAKVLVKLKLKVKSQLREECEKFCDFLFTILTNEGLNEFYKEALQAMKAWCVVGNSLVLEHLNLRNIILKALKDTSVTEFVIDMIIEAIAYSDLAHIFENVEFKESFSRIGKRQILFFLKDLIQYLSEIQPLIIQQMHNSDFYPIALKYAELASSIGENFIIILFEDTEICQALLNFLLMCTGHKERAISVETFDFWTTLKENIIRVAMENEFEVPHLFMKFLQICELIRVNCEYESTELTALDPDTEDEDLIESEGFKSMGLKEYRLFAEDIFFNSLYLLQQKFGVAGENQIFQLVEKILNFDLSTVGSDDTFIKKAESCIFLSKSLLQSIQPEEEEKPHEFVKYILTQILRLPLKPIIVLTSVLFISESPRQLNYFPDLIPPILRFVLTAASHNFIQSSAAKCIMEICEYCRETLSTADLEEIFHFLENNIEKLEVTNISRLSEAIGTKVTALPLQQMINVSEVCLRVPVNSLLSMNLEGASMEMLTSSKHMLSKYLSILVFYIKPFDSLAIPTSLSEKALLPILEKIVNVLSNLLMLYQNDNSIVTLICSIFHKSLGALNIKLSELFPGMARALLDCFQKNKKNTICIQTLSYSCSCLSSDEYFKKIIQDTFPIVCKTIIRSIDRANISTDLIQYFSELLTRIIESFEPLVVFSTELENIIMILTDCLVSIREYHCHRAILQFLQHFSSSSEKSISLKYTSHLSFTIISAIPNFSTALFLQTAHNLSIMLDVDFENCKEGIMRGLEALVYSNVENRIKNIVIECLLNLKDSPYQMKVIIGDLHNLINKMCQDDVFIAHELRLHQRAQRPKCTPIVIDLDKE